MNRSSHPHALFPCTCVTALFPVLAALCLLPALRAQTTIDYTAGENNSSPYTLTGSTTLTANGTDSDIDTQSGVLSGTGPVHKNGPATLAFTADNTYTGDTYVDAGELLLGSYPTATSAGSVVGNISLATGTAVDFMRSNAVTFNGNITYTGDGTGSSSARDGAVDITAPGTSFTLAAGTTIDVRNFYLRGGTLNLEAGSTVTAYYANADVGMYVTSPNGNDSTVNLANGATIGTSSNFTSIYLGGSDSTSATDTLNILANATVDLSNSSLSLGGLNAGGAAALNVGTGATLSLSSPTIGGDASNTLTGNGSTATVTLASGSTLHLTNTADLHIGGDGTDEGNDDAKGDGGDATVNVNSATLTVDDGRLIIGGDGDYSSHHGGNGTLNLDGSATTLDLAKAVNNQPIFQIGGDGGLGGNGTVNITNGATLNVSDTYLGSQNGAGGNGTMTVSGSGSTLNVKAAGSSQGNLYLGSGTDGADGYDGAAGTLSLSDHATGTVTGIMTVGGSGDSNGTGHPGGAGTVSLSTNATLTVAGDLTVGGMASDGDTDASGDGTVNVKTGATLVYQSDLYLGGQYSGEEPDLVNGHGTLNLGTGTISTQGTENEADIVLSLTGTLNIGYDGTAATAAPTNFDPDANGPIYIDNYGVINFRHSSGTFTLASPIDGNGAMHQTGAGTTVLSGDNTDFTGTTTVSAGTLHVIDTLGGTVDVQSGGTLGGIGTFTGLVTADSGAHIAPGNSPGTITFHGGLTLDGGSVLDYQLGTTSDLIKITGGTLTGPSSGAVTLNLSDAGGFAAGTYTLFDYTTATGTSSFDVSDFAFGSTISGYTYSLGFSGSTLQLTATAVPEPATYALIAGLAVLCFVFWRKRRSRV